MLILVKGNIKLLELLRQKGNAGEEKKIVK
jgi:hypothetical protein